MGKLGPVRWPSSVLHSFFTGYYKIGYIGPIIHNQATLKNYIEGKFMSIKTSNIVRAVQNLNRRGDLRIQRKKYYIEHLLY